jgi:hypothetical protein
VIAAVTDNAMCVDRATSLIVVNPKNLGASPTFTAMLALYAICL